MKYERTSHKNINFAAIAFTTINVLTQKALMHSMRKKFLCETLYQFKISCLSHGYEYEIYFQKPNVLNHMYTIMKCSNHVWYVTMNLAFDRFLQEIRQI